MLPLSRTSKTESMFWLGVLSIEGKNYERKNDSMDQGLFRGERKGM